MLWVDKYLDESEEPTEHKYLPLADKLSDSTIVFWNLNVLTCLLYKFKTVVVVNCPLSIFSPIAKYLPRRLIVDIWFYVL